MSCPEDPSEEVVYRLVRIKESHRHWGARKLQIVYERSWGKAPSESSIKRVLERNGMVAKRQKQRDATPSERMRLSVKREVQAVATERVERSAAERQAHFETWRHEFNHERPVG